MIVIILKSIPKDKSNTFSAQNILLSKDTAFMLFFHQFALIELKNHKIIIK